MLCIWNINNKNCSQTNLDCVGLGLGSSHGARGRHKTLSSRGRRSSKWHWSHAKYTRGSLEAHHLHETLSDTAIRSYVLCDFFAMQCQLIRVQETPVTLWHSYPTTPKSSHPHTPPFLSLQWAWHCTSLRTISNWLKHLNNHPNFLTRY